MRNRIITLITVLALVVISSGIFAVNADGYPSSETIPVTVPETGVVHIERSLTVGAISIDIAATPGTTGSVLTETWPSGNPHPEATVPGNVQLSNFFTVAFNIPEQDFIGATLVFTYDHYMEAPTLYKLSADGTSYNPMTNAVIDTTARTITITLTSTTDPTFAVGQASTTSPTPTENTTESALLYVGIGVVVIVVIAIVGIFLIKRSKK